MNLTSAKSIVVVLPLLPHENVSHRNTDKHCSGVTLMRFYRWLVACKSLNICIIFLLLSPKIEPRFYASESYSNGKESRKSLSELCEIKLITRHGPIVGPPPWGGACVFINSLKFSDLLLTVSQPQFSCTADKITYIYIYICIYIYIYIFFFSLNDV